MKKVKIEVRLDIDEFISLMESGYSGGGDDNVFRFTTLGGKNVENIAINQETMLAWHNFTTAKQILLNSLKKEK